MAVAERVMGVAGKIAGKQSIAQTGAVSWVTQRVTAVLVGVFIGVHIWILHFTAEATSGNPITFEAIRQRMSSPWYVALDALLLASLVYHALNGVRAVLLDWGVGAKSEKALTGTLFVLGIILTGYGAYALVPFLTGK
ncbi:MAG: succinate dehydrogenase, cytochrome b556 subunit [Dehalococcoidia bacterium]|nr:succinate dehydrogenase, cytochrome b556 subunit [Dehalococcoidia bacterium]